MVQILLIVLIAITFGYIFAKLDTLAKTNKMLIDETSKLKQSIENFAKDRK